MRQSQHAILPNHKLRQTSPWLPWFPAPHLFIFHASARKQLRKNKSKTSSDNSQSSGDELLQVNASESSKDVVSDVADECASESKAKHVVSKKTKCWLFFEVPSKGKFYTVLVTHHFVQFLFIGQTKSACTLCGKQVFLSLRSRNACSENAKVSSFLQVCQCFHSLQI